MNYNIIVNLEDNTVITIPAEYENEYSLKQNVTAIGNNGVWQHIGENYTFTPSHKIRNIYVLEDNKIK